MNIWITSSSGSAFLENSLTVGVHPLIQQLANQNISEMRGMFYFVLLLRKLLTYDWKQFSLEALLKNDFSENNGQIGFI